jgi:hypothetical protein
LFSGAWGFRLAAFFERRVGPLSTIGVEESLSVYDHPPVWVVVETAGCSPAVARALLERVPLPASTNWHPKELTVPGVAPYRQR